METNYWAHRTATPEQIQEWVEQFHRDGYLFLQDVLTPDMIPQLKADLDRALVEHNEEGDGVIQLHHRMFETSRANLRLFDMEPIVTFAETLIGQATHVIHNNSFRTPLGKGITTWHQDDSSHYIVTHGEPPTNVRLPVLLFTANYYLTDVTERKYGPTEVIPRSHLFGASPPSVIEGTKWESQVVPCLGKAGSVVMFNNQVWHRGGPNLSDRVRYITQVSYARRLVGHKYYPFMNYQMPEHVYADANPRLKRLLGFLPSGAYG
ncbi:MAG TPA: phytanoyl-CoA dioxygenase family protein [Chthonomonadaceae bacterium]|nr:phytanoyl-CoA dioxygenase family protein [Chthonomonadaceae bacterium]